MLVKTTDGLGAAWYEELLQTGTSLYQKYTEVKTLQEAKKKAATQAAQLKQLQEMQQQIQAAKPQRQAPTLFSMNTTTVAIIGGIGIVALLALKR